MSDKYYALITGASSGIGTEFAKLAAADHYNLILVARSEDKLLELKKMLEEKYNVDVKIIIKDLSLINSASEVFEQTEKDNLRIELLFNNAGYGDYGPFTETKWKKESEMILLNIYTLTHFTKLYAKKMVSQGSGRILNVASIGGFLAGPLMAVYYSSKNYVLSFSLAIYKELKGTGVSLTVLCPGPTKTNFEKVADLESSKLFKNFKIDSAEFVARKGYKAMLKGKMLIIPGWMNKVMIATVRFTPRKLLLSVIQGMQKKVQ
jgi:short-subunit dehydrogenase